MADPLPPPAETVPPIPEIPPKKRWWRRVWFRWCVGLLVIAGIGTVSWFPTTRYWVLNHAQVRSSAGVTVVDQVTQQPLQNVTVSVAGVTVRTNVDGHAELYNLPLGPSTLHITQPGFLSVQRDVVIGWGSNPFGTRPLKAIGVQYHTIVTDWLSGKPIHGARVESDTAAVLSDAKGNAVLILPNNEATPDIAVTVRRDGYRTDVFTIKASVSTPVALVTNRKAVYVSKQSGTYDLYASDVDGQNKQVLLAGTGNEGANIGLAVSPDGSHAALVSTRDKQYDADGYPLSTLTLVDVNDGTSTVLTHADQVQLIDWIGTQLVFQQATASGAARYSVVSYDYASNSRYGLATAARFTGVLSAKGMVYYAVAPDPVNPSVQPYFYRVAPDGTGSQTLLEKEIWSMRRTGNDTFGLQTSDNWYTHTISTKNNTITSAPTTVAGTMFIEEPGRDGQSVWVAARSGQGALMLHAKDGKDTVLHVQSGLAYPVRWLTEDSAVFRVVTGSEIADYAVGTVAGRPVHKIADVTNTFGFTTGQ